jgi:hypothetical protein
MEPPRQRPLQPGRTLSWGTCDRDCDRDSSCQNRTTTIKDDRARTLPHPTLHCGRLLTQPDHLITALAAAMTQTPPSPSPQTGIPLRIITYSLSDRPPSHPIPID